ncbi:MAG TPA: nicotinate-nicotinamide nucleotide adenylyltransferase [Bryobacteraceae bacterium]|nr:nicotinate-nicotinamide nucleotide adenylyltransferase [Bryobacteraceae bacterium]
MRLHRRSAKNPRKLGILPGSFNPLTRAHVELAEAARWHVDEVLLVVPSVFPHKDYSGATLEERIAMIESAGLTVPHSIGASERGLFLDIAQECREHYGPELRLYFLCGRDAAERILTWDYGRPGVAEEMLQDFELLVAPRGGPLQPPAHLEHRIHPLEIRGEYDNVSSSEVRERIARGERWEHLVPESIVELVKKIYS